MPASAPPPAQRDVAAAIRRRKRRRRRIAAITLLGLLAVFHVPILRGIGSLLIVDDAAPQPGALLLMSGDGVYRTAEDLVAGNPNAIVLKPEFTKSRLEEMGIWPDRIAEFHRELTRRGIPDSAQVVLRGPVRTEWESIELLDRWLKPDAPMQVTALCDEFQSRRLRYVIDSVLNARSRQIGIKALPDRRYDSTNWWKSRAGIRTVILGGISLMTAMFHRPNLAPPPSWDPDVYEHSLLEPDHDKTATPASPGWLASVGRWLDIGEIPRAVDHVVLLPGDENVRPFVAAALVKAGLARDILVPQNFPTPAVADGVVPMNHEIISQILDRRGVGDRLRVLSMKSDGTIDDARATREVLDHEPDAHVAVVTSFYHTRRARMSFRAIYGSRADDFLYISAPVTDITADNWWEGDAGTQMIVTEVVKVVIYWVQYGPGKYWFAAAFVSLIVLWRWRRAARRRRLRARAASLVASTPSAAPASS
ncbi:MAG TPA: ElyC/SanA/YdcF family protein [Caulifigura sp.]|nr:ElyC/SanA/YdcF family protein [Caulifigura sp.]